MPRLGPPNLARTVRNFSFPVTRRRYAASSMGTGDSDGYLVPGAATNATILAHVHDAPGDVMERLPEGYEGRQLIQGYTPDDIRTSDDTTGVRADAISFRGELFEVIEVATWNSGRDGTATWFSFIAAKVVR